MLKKFLLICLVLSLSTSSALATELLGGPVGVFDNLADVGTPGNPIGVGHTWIGGTVERDGELVEQYYMVAAGSDIFGNNDHFQFAYKQLTGSIRLSAELEHIATDDGWAKVGPMIRADLTPGSVNYMAVLSRSKGNRYQWRHVADQGSGSGNNVGNPTRHGIQRVQLGPYQVVQRLLDFGSGWEVQGQTFMPDLPDEVYVGIAATHHKNAVKDGLGQFSVIDPLYEVGVSYIGDIVQIPETSIIEPCGDKSGFLVRTIKAGQGTDFNGDRWTESYPKMNEILDTDWIGSTEGVVDFPPGRRVEEFINFDDGGDGFAFNAGNGFPGHSWPGIDSEPVEIAPGDTSKGDGDDQFAAEALGCIYLTAGYHVFGAKGDDGAQLKIGGVLLGQTTGWNNEGTWLIDVQAEGFYALEGRFFEQGGGAPWELYEILANGTKVLMNDRAAGASPVYVPEPATIALLGFGGLSLLRMRKKR